MTITNINRSGFYWFCVLQLSIKVNPASFYPAIDTLARSMFTGFGPFPVKFWHSEWRYQTWYY